MFRDLRPRRRRTSKSELHEIDAELAQHVERRAARLRERGIAPEEATRLAHERFGDPARVRRDCLRERQRARRRWRRRALVIGVLQDLRFAARSLVAAPGFTVAVITILAVGLGATSAVFGIVHQVMLRPLPYAEPERLAAIERVHTKGPEGPAQLAPPDFAELRDRLRGARLTALDESIILPLVGADRPIHVDITPVIPDALEVIGIEPSLGRGFLPNEGNYDPDNGWAFRPAVLSHELWLREFGGDPAVLGRRVEINNVPTEIVGVMPPGFAVLMPSSAKTTEHNDVWYPVQWDFRSSRPDGARLRGLARLSPGVTVAQLQAELDALAVQLESEYPYNEGVGKRFRALPLQQAVTSHVSGGLRTFSAGVGLVLLIVCANVANLLLVHGGRRQRELAVRAALGASRARLVRQMLAETLLLGAAAATLGLGLATVLLGLVRSFPPRDLPRAAGLSLDTQIFGFTVLVSVIAVLVSSLVPVLRATAAATRLASTDRSATADRRQQRTQRVLVVAEVALSIVLLAGAGLMLRSFIELQRVPLGFEPGNLLTLNTTTITEYGDPRQATEDEILRRLRAIPGVVEAGLGFPLPLNGVYERAIPFRADADDVGAAVSKVYFRTISPGYLETLGIELLQGRYPSADDNTRDVTHGKVVIDEVLAARHWPGRSALGQRFWLGEMFDLDDWPDDYEVVGVVRFVPQGDHRDDQPTVYVPRQMFQSVELGVALRTVADPAAVADAARAALATVDARMPVDPVRMTDLIAASLAPTRFTADVLVGFSAVALFLAAVGLHAVLSHGVRRRTREIGIRLALGADAGRVRRQVVVQALALAVLGTLLGLGAALLTARLLEGQLYGVRPTDLVTFAGTAAVVVALAVASAWVPARRAAAVEPQSALRQE